MPRRMERTAQQESRLHRLGILARLAEKARADVEEAKEDAYRAGCSVTEIAAASGVSYQAIQQWVAKREKQA